MKKRTIRTVMVFGLVPLFCGFGVGSCDWAQLRFEPVSLNGFDPGDNAEDWNDYPWSMAYFVPDGETEGHVYVGTGNGIDELAMSGLGMLDESPYRPPEIRRYRPDLGKKQWERVFDYRDIEDGPDYTSTGFRFMTVYRAQSDEVNYLYASTFGSSPTIWRSATGEPGSWESVWTSGENGSIRGMATHNGLLYIAISNDLVMERTPGQIWATDGDAIWPVMQDGFGNDANHAIMALMSYNGWLYAGTANAETGYEVWRLEGPGKNGAEPVLVVNHGGPSCCNQAAATMCVFQDKLYVGNLTFVGSAVRGCDLIRISPDDSWETIVGPDSLSGYDSGFNRRTNTYLWWMVEHDGDLYASTWDFASVAQVVADNLDLVGDAFIAIRGLLEEGGLPSFKRTPTVVSTLTEGGADLYRSADGVTWTSVFTDGLGDPYNYGVRTMVSAEGCLYLGMANPFDGLEIWRSRCCAAE